MHRILDLVDAEQARGRTVYLHCWGGVGRTGTVVGCHLIERGYGAERTLERIEELRRGSSKAGRGSPETPAQSAYVRTWPATRRSIQYPR